ncbi:MAG: zinc ribbon domain-containing protein [Oscillospiraceae bacterium]|nr:zinc ribbon domain-containing protein [Oscillospiraceae bacterium]
MYCTKCGKELELNAKFCVYCGNALDDGNAISDNKKITYTDNSDLDNKVVTENTSIEPKIENVEHNKATFNNSNIEIDKKVNNEKNNKSFKVVGFVVFGILVFILLVIGLIIFCNRKKDPQEVYVMACHYLSDNVFRDEAVIFGKYNEDNVYISDEKETHDFGDGNITYIHYKIYVPVSTSGNKEKPEEYKVDVYVHMFGFDGVFEELTYAKSSGDSVLEDLLGKKENKENKKQEESESKVKIENDEDKEVLSNQSEEDVIQHSDIAGAYKSLHGNDYILINIYTSPENTEIGNFDYTGMTGTIYYEDNQYILRGDVNMVMNVNYNENGVLQLQLWAETGGVLYDELVMMEHYQS